MSEHWVTTDNGKTFTLSEYTDEDKKLSENTPAEVFYSVFGTDGCYCRDEDFFDDIEEGSTYYDENGGTYINSCRTVLCESEDHGWVEYNKVIHADGTRVGSEVRLLDDAEAIQWLTDNGYDIDQIETITGIEPFWVGLSIKFWIDEGQHIGWQEHESDSKRTYDEDEADETYEWWSECFPNGEEAAGSYLVHVYIMRGDETIEESKDVVEVEDTDEDTDEDTED